MKRNAPERRLTGSLTSAAPARAALRRLKQWRRWPESPANPGAAPVGDFRIIVELGDGALTVLVPRRPAARNPQTTIVTRADA
jgi:hypothetical protein